jgi:hypothetical protein
LKWSKPTPHPPLNPHLFSLSSPTRKKSEPQKNKIKEKLRIISGRKKVYKQREIQKLVCVCAEEKQQSKIKDKRESSAVHATR